MVRISVGLETRTNDFSTKRLNQGDNDAAQQPERISNEQRLPPELTIYLTICNAVVTSCLDRLTIIPL